MPGVTQIAPRSLNPGRTAGTRPKDRDLDLVKGHRPLAPAMDSTASGPCCSSREMPRRKGKSQLIRESQAPGFPMSKPYVICRLEEGEEPCILEREISTGAPADDMI
ncbi:zinc finger protein 514 isoform X4 [Physeter macrocephalus]|uniref:Zinc finger protein 514 isoform X4 n=1 Tax=Physeter macrocephalus TaxID=9755 RepID=A0A455BV79_PHYMC|nr:zinc finger protein 514 isoform X4 [Physeter catodon]|eukprot:XP_028352889.1 zinc finger protein 514 isoform X3 [Physeter catodon]